MRKQTFIATALTLGLSCGLAVAHDYQLGDLTIEHPVARATPVNAPVSGGYMSITNNGEMSDRLIGGSVSFAGKVEVHEMAMDGDVMKMREINGLEIPPGETVVLKPGGYHIMFMQLNTQLKEGDVYRATLEFERAGEVEIDLSVEGLDKIKGGHNH